MYHVYVYEYVDMYLNMHTYLCMYMYVRICLYVCAYATENICFRMCMSMGMCMLMYECVCLWSCFVELRLRLILYVQLESQSLDGFERVVCGFCMGAVEIMCL